MAMEEEFEMEIPDEDAEKIVTIKDIIEYVKKRTKDLEVFPMTKISENK